MIQNVKMEIQYGKNGNCELYDLENDSSETKNILEQETEKTEEFKSKISEHIEMEDTFRKTTRGEEMKVDKGI